MPSRNSIHAHLDAIASRKYTSAHNSVCRRMLALVTIILCLIVWPGNSLMAIAQILESKATWTCENHFHLRLFVTIQFMMQSVYLLITPFFYYQYVYTKHDKHTRKCALCTVGVFVIYMLASMSISSIYYSDESLSSTESFVYPIVREDHNSTLHTITCLDVYSSVNNQCGGVANNVELGHTVLTEEFNAHQCTLGTRLYMSLYGAQYIWKTTQYIMLVVMFALSCAYSRHYSRAYLIGKYSRSDLNRFNDDKRQRRQKRFDTEMQ